MSELIDNRAHRIRALKDIIKHLHAGQAPEQVKDRLTQIVRQTDYSEIVAMEQELMAEGVPACEIASMCDLHSQVTRDVLVQMPPRQFPPGHPASVFGLENQALREELARLRGAMSEVRSLPEDGDPAAPLARWREAFNNLMDVEKHYQRKEHCLFPFLEKYGITGPPKVMWAKHDQTRALLKDLGQALSRPGVPAAGWRSLAASAGETVAGAIEEMIYKEDNILLPMCIDRFTEDDWAEIWASSPRYGWCLVAPADDWRPAVPVIPKGLELPATEGIQLPSGNLSVEQLLALFAALPVDLTFVDADDRVGFFSEGPDRIFARSRAIIGRKVQHCHPPKSVDVVDRIVNDFREGRRSVAEFWIQMHGRFVHIRYFAVRSEAGQYLGTLEVTQDITRIRALEGERRLLQYDDAPATA
jgi:DUF438 domain-containing protein